MNTTHRPLRPLRSIRSIRSSRPAVRGLVLSCLLVALAATLALLLASCGGGVGTGGTGSFSYAAGPITGFGSIVVNDVHFDESAARVEDADGNVSTRDALRLGMTVDVDGGDIAPATATTSASASATRVRYASEMLGGVGTVDRAALSFTLLGQTVLVDANTVFDDALSGGLAALGGGRMVEVYALFDAATTRYRATRIEPRASTAEWRLRGVVSALDTAARSLVIGAATFSYAGAAGVPADLAVGQFVRLRVQSAAPTATRFNVSAFGSATVALPERAGAKIKGLVTAFTSPSSFSVNGQPVNGAAASFPNGRALGVGTRVEVVGTVLSGVLQAGSVSVESEQAAQGRGFEIKGSISAVNAALHTFVVRGVTVGTSRSDLRIDDGSLLDIKVGREVEVKGLLSDDGTRLDATRIKFD